jgi:hypothetical protein
VIAVLGFVALVVLAAGLPLAHWMYSPWRNR